jgi:alkylation response protein AidB-like acyl-CoA dehydrogenase
MRPTYEPDVETFRQKVRSFLTANLSKDWRGIGHLAADETHDWVMQWRATLHREGYLAPGWPSEYGGGGMSALEQVIVAEEFARAGVPTGGPNDGFGITMLGNTLLRWGTEEQKKYYLPRILSNEDIWCQGYSEPNAGSDLPRR